MGSKICPICNAEKNAGDFRKSHFIPASLYHSGKKGLQFGTRSGSGKMERHIKDLSLCDTCERLLDEGGESYVLSHIAANVTDEFPLHLKLRLALRAKAIPTCRVFPVTI
jgi:hypothetical protein